MQSGENASTLSLEKSPAHAQLLQRASPLGWWERFKTGRGVKGALETETP